MPYKLEWHPPELFLEHNGVSVWHTYKDNDDMEQYEYWFTNFDAEGYDNEDDDYSFDVRLLSTWIEKEPGKGVDQATAIREAIDKGEIKQNELFDKALQDQEDQ